MIEFRAKGMEEVLAHLNRLAEVPTGRTGLMPSIAAEVESQTRRRLHEEKQSPAGDAWKPWSPEYAKTRHGGHSLLVSRGHLRDSIEFIERSSQVVEVGSDVVYAPRNQETRPFLGLSDDNRRAIVEIIGDHIMEVLSA